MPLRDDGATLADMKIFTAILAAVLLAGCATSSHQFAAPAAGSKITTGQCRYEGSGVSVIGDLTVARGGGTTRIEFSKGPGLSLIRVIADATHIRFEGPLARGSREFARGAGLPSHLLAWGQLAENPAGSRKIAAGGTTLTSQLPPGR